MKIIFKLFLIFMLLSVFWVNISYADQERGPLTKLGRGIANLLTGWIEFPVTVSQSAHDRGYITGIYYGVPTGIVRTILRTVAGVYEIVTFPFPFPNEYGDPIVEPEFVMEPLGGQLEDVRGY